MPLWAMARVDWVDWVDGDAGRKGGDGSAPYCK